MTGDLWGGAEVQVATAADRVVLRWFADRVVAVSARAAESLRHSWLWGAPIAQIHNGVNLGTVRAARTPWEVRQTLGIERDELISGPSLARQEARVSAPSRGIDPGARAPVQVPVRGKRAAP